MSNSPSPTPYLTNPVHEGSRLETDSLFGGFLTGDRRVDRVLLNQVLDDARHAVLSPQFRVYYRLRRLIPLAIRQHLQRFRKPAEHCDWYLPTDCIRALIQCIAALKEEPHIIHPWPDAARFSFVLTHDVDTSDGFRNILPLARIEEELGLRSSWYLVPHKYPIDHGLVAELESRSFEIGIHGYNHDGRLYASKRIFDRRARAINSALKKYGAVGFRSPMVHRNLAWLQSLDIEYDASCFDIDPFQPMPGGVGSIWPFVAGKFVELPYTLPQDHTLLVALQQQDCRIWKHKLDFVASHHGMALMLTHPDYLVGERNLSFYRDFLIHVREVGGFWHALPREVAAWWRLRAQSTLGQNGSGQWQVHGPVQDHGVPAVIEADGQDLAIHTTCHSTHPANSPVDAPLTLGV
jgi:hypothetical protein